MHVIQSLSDVHLSFKGSTTEIGSARGGKNVWSREQGPIRTRMTISSSRARRREYRRRPSQAHPPSSTSAPSSSRRPSPRLPRHFRNSVAEDHYFDIISLIQDVSVTVTKYLLKMIGYSDTEIHQSLKSDTIRKQQLTTTPVDVTVSNISCIITYQQLIPDSKKGNRTLIF